MSLELYSVVLTVRARWTARILRPRYDSGRHQLVRLVAQLADLVRGAQQLPIEVPVWLDVNVVAPVTPQRKRAVLSVRVNYVR